MKTQKGYSLTTSWMVGLAVLSLLTSLTVARAANPGALGEPVQAVLNDYAKINQALVKDSTEGVAEHAKAISQAVREDKGKTLSLSVAERADKLAAAKDLKAARQAFKPLSQSLIDYLAENKVKSTGYKEAYCPMAEASWLQKGQKIQNPYMGKSMPTCGDIKRSF